MHTEVRKFIKRVRNKHRTAFFNKKVLEVGSLNVNGTVRDYFWFCDYTGIDLNKGKDVNIVCPAYEFNSPGYFDTVISTGVLEHDKHWQKSLESMYNNLKPGGLLLITCQGPDFPEHGTEDHDPACSPFTTNYYGGILVQDFSRVLVASGFKEYHIEDDRRDLFFYGVKN
jgi:SAM-dependent methyltransferase